jgi:hypothetical protein
MSYPKKNNKNINRASKNKILATAHASFGNPFAFKTANFVPKRLGAVASKPRPFSPFAFLGGKSNAFSPPTFALPTAPLLGLRPATKGAIPLGFPAALLRKSAKRARALFFFFIKARDV